MGIVTPHELFLFTDSARSTILPVPGAKSELADLGSRKAWKIGRVILAQAGLRSMTSGDKNTTLRVLLSVCCGHRMR